VRKKTGKRQTTKKTRRKRGREAKFVSSVKFGKFVPSSGSSCQVQEVRVKFRKFVSSSGSSFQVREVRVKFRKFVSSSGSSCQVREVRECHEASTKELSVHISSFLVFFSKP
jgi:hypothetical protein